MTETKTINLRDLPEDFVRKAKAYAALSGMTLKDFVIQAVQSAMQDEILPNATNSAFATQVEAKDGKEKPRRLR